VRKNLRRRHLALFIGARAGKNKSPDRPGSSLTSNLITGLEIWEASLWFRNKRIARGELLGENILLIR